MKQKKIAIIMAGILAAAAAMTGCAEQNKTETQVDYTQNSQWHGCGYKDAEQGKKKQNIKPDFDYALVPGPVFVKTKSGLILFKSKLFRCF